MNEPQTGSGPNRTPPGIGLAIVSNNDDSNSIKHHNIYIHIHIYIYIFGTPPPLTYPFGSF